MWLEHLDTASIIQEAWKRGYSLATKLKNTKMALREWNKVVFGDIHKKLQTLRDHIETLQQQLLDSKFMMMEQATMQNLADLEKERLIFCGSDPKQDGQRRGISTLISSTPPPPYVGGTTAFLIYLILTIYG